LEGVEGWEGGVGWEAEGAVVGGGVGGRHGGCACEAGREGRWCCGGHFWVESVVFKVRLCCVWQSMCTLMEGNERIESWSSIEAVEEWGLVLQRRRQSISYNREHNTLQLRLQWGTD
jgi:hypothetical protein